MTPELPLATWVALTAADTPLPAGGSAAAVSTAFAAALVAKLARIGERRARTDAERDRAAALAVEADELRAAALAMAVEDAEVYNATRGAGVDRAHALLEAGRVPLRLLHAARRTRELAAEMALRTTAMTQPDARVAELLAGAAVRSARIVVIANAEAAARAGAADTAVAALKAEAEGD